MQISSDHDPRWGSLPSSSWVLLFAVCLGAFPLGCGDEGSALSGSIDSQLPLGFDRVEIRKQAFS